jgi:hypothetical protein
MAGFVPTPGTVLAWAIHASTVHVSGG